MHEQHIDQAVHQHVAAQRCGVVTGAAGFVGQHRGCQRQRAQARTQGLDKVVLKSAMGANADPSAPLRRAAPSSSLKPVACRST
jgi:hypothetical protein